MTSGAQQHEPAHDIFHQGQRSSLGVFFAPRSIAVIGSGDDRSIASIVFSNLLKYGFGGTVFPVSPDHLSVEGVSAYPDLTAIRQDVDLAVIATPAERVPEVVRQCVAVGVRGAVIVSSGFRETGAEGLALEQEILTEARKGNIRIVGPNCLGVMSPSAGVNATFAADMARPGSVAFLSQSGSLCTAILDWSLQENVGFSAFVSMGSMLDVSWGDLIDYFGDDPRTRSIILYMESIGDAQRFMSAAREVALTKPIIVMKAGRTNAASRAARSHTGSLTGSDEVLEAAFRRAGVLRVNRVSDLFYMADVLGKQPRPAGPRLTIITNAGGPGVIATDALVGDGGQLAELSAETKERLDLVLPTHWSRGNPVDILADADADRYANAVEIASRDPDTDGVLVILSPQGVANPTQIAERLKGYARINGKPILATWMGGAGVLAGENILNAAGIPTVAFPDSAAHAFYYMWQYTRNLRNLYETPSYVEGWESRNADQVRDFVTRISMTGRELLDPQEAAGALAAYGIPVVQSAIAASVDEAVVTAAETGYPVVMKLLSRTISHKSDVGGVHRNLSDEDSVRKAWEQIRSAVPGEAFEGVIVQPMVRLADYELILGSTVDPQFGPVLMFGAGGELVELLQDHALALPPLNTTLARSMIAQTRMGRILQGVRGRRPVNLDNLEKLIVRFSQLVVEQPRIKEIDINPILVSSEQIIAVDARIVLHPAAMQNSELPQSVIRPYPTQYVTNGTLRDGTTVRIRPIRPEDEPLMVRFHETLSDETLHFRYFAGLTLNYRIAHERLTRICFIDYAREMALVAEITDEATQAREIIAVARMTRYRGLNQADIAILVSDPWQNRGLGTKMTQMLMDVARQENVEALVADILPENRVMQRVFKRLGFQLRHSMEEEVVKAEIRL